MAGGAGMAYNGSPHLDANPYDGPFAVMQGMKKEVHELHVLLKEEQSQRTAEVGHLKTEIAHLRDALVKEIAERQAQCHALTNDFTVFRSSKSKALDELKHIHRTQLGQINQMLQEEVRDRKAAEDLSATREQVADRGRQEDSALIREEFGMYKNQFTSFRDDLCVRIDEMCHCIEFILAHLAKVSHASEIAKNVSTLFRSRATLGFSPPRDPRAELGGSQGQGRSPSISRSPDDWAEEGAMAKTVSKSTTRSSAMGRSASARSAARAREASPSWKGSEVWASGGR